MKAIIKSLGVVAVVLVLSMPSFATPMLRISSGGASCTFTDNLAVASCSGGGIDNGTGDALGASGALLASATVGVFTINVSTGVTKPNSGSAAVPYLDLNTFNQSTAAGSVTIEFTETFFTGLGNSLLRFGGTTAGTAEYSAYWDAGNAAFAQTTLLGTSGVLPAGGYGGPAATFAGGGTTSAAYSLTQVVTYTHFAGGNSSGDHELTVPEPGMLSLLGVGVLALGVLRRRYM